MFKKLLIISGPTATGKTAMAVKLAKKLNGELISADSRQLYRDLEIGVGKDHPHGTPIHLIDLINPDTSYSVALYRQQALNVIRKLQQQNKLPILVGCSGFYIDSIINSNYNTFSVKPIIFLRKIFNLLPLSVMQIILRLISPVTYKNLNNSDLHNPIRLIRKIEILASPHPSQINQKKINFDTLHISLTAPSYFLYQRIDQRVEERLKIGHLVELTNLLKKYKWSDPGLKISAYKCFQPYFSKKESLSYCIQKWKYSEHRDARRQKTWFKKIRQAKIIDISKPFSVRKASEIVQRWYNKS